MKKPNSTMILNWRSRLIKNYLSKVFSVIEHNTNQLSLIPNNVKLRINLIGQLKTDYVMVKNGAISAVSNTIKKLHIHKICIWHTNKTYIGLNRSKYMIFYWIPCSRHGRYWKSNVDWRMGTKYWCCCLWKIYTKIKSYHQLRRKLIVMIKQNSGQK